MYGVPRGAWLPRWLFRLSTGLAALLGAAVLLAPWLDDGAPHPNGWSLLVAVFSHDAAVRRTAVSAAVGLIVTACVCFRQPGATRPRRRPPAPPRNIAGA